ncbi:glycosyltransferase family 2 protein [Rhizobium rhizogenes]|uniref:glycosyltransferase family 2 protein n=1 Tax=Rhizobium rhizogenes TaxID=359 RepID=UPI001574E67D|nr:glycosyltransferase family A protein [Rhizobium rhizogenes]NTI23921.1 glycosyltransferase family 2 protein [Rhizobium rhizogenes]QTG07414.1 glycosyltransferase family 2 protein [Rhizobium rhizogenes]
MFSLIVCTIDRFDQLERLFLSLSSQRYQDFEVVVVDQNPDDRLSQLVGRFSPLFTIRHIRSAKGLSRARNNGMAAATGDYVCFPDDDCWYEPNTLEMAERLFVAHPELAVVTGRTLDAGGMASVSPTGEVPLAVTRWNYLKCGNSNGIFVRRAALADIGGFDENLGVGSDTPFQSGEEADFLLRALATGKQLMFFPELIVHHDQVTDEYGPRQVERARKYGRGFGALMRKQRFPLVYVGYRLLRPVGGWLAALVRFNADAARYKRAWLMGILEGYATWPRWGSG